MIERNKKKDETDSQRFVLNGVHSTMLKEYTIEKYCGALYATGPKCGQYLWPISSIF